MFDVWKNVLAHLEKELPHDTFITWFQDVSLSSMEDGKIEIRVPSVIKSNVIEKKYLPNIKQAFLNNNVKVTEITFTTSSANNKVRSPREVPISGIIKKSQPSQNTPINKFTKRASSNLNSKYTLDNFVIGKYNDYAATIAGAVIKDPGSKYNPFFLYGGSGLGKTHLVQAIGNEILRLNPDKKVLYTSTPSFYSEFIDSIKKKKTDEFTRKYKELDVLIIDDFQMIMNKDASQEEFFNIFNEMYNSNKQIIVTSDRLPDQIKSVDPRLASRLAWAGPIDLQMPNFEERCAILKAKADYMGIYIEDEAVEEIANNIKSSIRDLEGEFTKITTLADLKETTPLRILNEGSYSLIQNNSGGGNHGIVTVKKILDITSQNYGITIADLKSRSRVANIKNARHVAMYLMSEELRMSTTNIATEVGVKDHTTVMHGVGRIRDEIQRDYALRDTIDSIRSNLYV